MIALIAHDEKKDDMSAFVRQHLDFFRTAPTGGDRQHGRTADARDGFGNRVAWRMGRTAAT